MKIKPLLILLFILGCSTNSTDMTLPGVNPKDLIVPIESYPADWKVLPCESMLCENNNGLTYEQSFNPVNYEPGQSFQEVYRFNSLSKAQEKFIEYQNGEYNREVLDSKGTDFSPPSKLPYTSAIADKYYFACGHQFGLVCKMIARYQNYFIFMYFDMDDGQGYGLTYQEVEKILIGLDEQILSHLRQK